MGEKSGHKQQKKCGVDAGCARLKWHGNWSRVHREGMCLMKCNNTVPVGPLHPCHWISGYVLWLECLCSTAAMLFFFWMFFNSLCWDIWLHLQMCFLEYHCLKKLSCHCSWLIHVNHLSKNPLPSPLFFYVRWREKDKCEQDGIIIVWTIDNNRHQRQFWAV